MPAQKLSFTSPLSGLKGYALAIVSAGAGLGLSLIAQSFGFRDIPIPLFLFGIAIVSWYGGARAAALAIVLASLAFNYFFTEPLYSFYVAASDLPYFLIFVTFAVLIVW